MKKEIDNWPGLKKEIQKGVVDALKEFELENGNNLIMETYLIKEKTKDQEAKRRLATNDITNRLAVIQAILINMGKKLE